MQMDEDPGRLQNYWYIQQAFVTGGNKGLQKWCEMQKSVMNGQEKLPGKVVKSLDILT